MNAKCHRAVRVYWRSSFWVLSLRYTHLETKIKRSSEHVMELDRGSNAIVGFYLILRHLFLFQPPDLKGLDLM